MRNRELLSGLVDLLLDRSCLGCAAAGPSLCSDCAQSIGQNPHEHIMVPRPTSLPPVFVAGSYDDLLRRAVLVLKDRRDWSLVPPLGALLAGAVAGALAFDDPHEEVALVPIPASRRAIRIRGDDVVTQLARQSKKVLQSNGFNVRVVPALRSARSRGQQKAMNVSQRSSNVRGAFALDRSVLSIAHRRAVVVDDVATTGSTLAEAVRLLSHRHVEVIAGVCLAGAVRRGTVRT